jgi:hypothetical protein
MGDANGRDGSADLNASLGHVAAASEIAGTGDTRQTGGTGGNGGGARGPNGGPGELDEGARRFSPAERRVAEVLAAEGRHVVALADRRHRGTHGGGESDRQPAGRAEGTTAGTAGATVGGTPGGRVRERAPGSRPDALVDGEPTDFAVLEPGDTSVAVTMALSRAARHADHAVIDARGSGLSQSAAEVGVRRFLAVPHSHALRGWRIIGDDYDLYDLSA